MGPLVRIFARYAVGMATGALLSKGLIPQELATSLQDDTVVTAVTTGFLGVCAFSIEWLYQKAKKRGWTL